MPKKSIIGGEVFLKKRTGAHGAMAELLSKSNEAQIKDQKASSADIRRPAPAKNPETIKNKAEIQQRIPVAAAPAKKNAQTTERIPERKPAMQKMPQGRSAQQRISQNMKVNDALRERPAAPMANERKPSPAPKAAVKKVKKSISIPKIKIPVKAVVCAASAIAVIAIAAIVISIARSTVSEATFEPDAYIGTDLKVSEDAEIFHIKDSDDAKHDGRNHVTISIFEGKEMICSTGASTVGEVLANMNVTVEGDYVLRGNETDAITADRVISIDKVTYGTVTEESSVPFETKYVDVQTIARGKTKVAKAGANGVSTATYRVTYVNGVESERVLESQVITKQPTTQIVNRGVGGTITIGGKTYSYSHYIDCKTTVYTGGGTTASGLPATEAVIAVDPRVIPLGTKVYVADSYCYVGIRTAADTGGVIKGNFIDIYFDEDNPSLKGYGVRRARVYILD